MLRASVRTVAFAMASLALGGLASADPSLERGKYLATVMLCSDCHSPQLEQGGPDLAKALTGGLGFEVPGLGIFWAPNLTPAQSGLAEWSEDDIVTAIREGVRPDGRELAPIMPSKFFAHLTDEDARSIALYLMSLDPVENAVPEPVGPGEPAKAPYLTMVMPDKGQADDPIIEMRETPDLTADLVALVDRTMPDPGIDAGFVALTDHELDRLAQHLVRQLDGDPQR